MKAKKRMFLFLMLIALCLSSRAQSRIEVIGKDTSAIIPIQQLRIANGWFVDLKLCTQRNYIYSSSLDDYTKLIFSLEKSNSFLKEANKLTHATVLNKQQIIDLADKEKVKEKKKTTRKIKFLKLQRTTLIGVCVFLAGKLIFFP